MKLTFHRSYQSITAFSDIELPALTILTGLNGGGKSHLLQAIREGAISVEGVDKANIAAFDLKTFQMPNEAIIKYDELVKVRTHIFQGISQINSMALEYISPHDLPALLKSAEEKSLPFYYLPLKVFEEIGNPSLYQRHVALRDNVETWISHSVQTENLGVVQQGLLHLLRITRKPFHLIKSEDLDTLYLPITSSNNLILNGLGKVFKDYWDKWEENEYRKFRNASNGEHFPVLGPQEFEFKYGEKPWVVVNRILRRFGSLQYEVNDPEKLERSNDFQLVLQSLTDKAVTINFGALSSGEQIMMSLVSAIYKTKIDSVFPKVLLLDEIDAPLHPSMSKSLIEVLENDFTKIGMEIILVSHSPSTIALAPEDAIYVMNKTGINRLVKTSKSDALNILTEGFASLTFEESNLQVSYNISKSSSHVLLTEGITDRIIIEAAWKKLRNTPMAFDLQDCFDAAFLRNMFMRKEIFKNYPTKTFLALFDFDNEGYSQWKALSDYQITQTDPFLGLLKKHPQYNGYTALLPVPTNSVQNQVIRSGHDTFAEKAHMPIELLFYDVPSVAHYFTSEVQVGGGSIVKFTGDKVGFANHAKENFTAQDFQHFSKLIEMLERIFA